MSHKDRNRCHRDKWRSEKIVRYISRLNLEFRDISGKSNNLENPTWGEAGQQLHRKAPSDYSNGKSEPAGQNRPSARLVSNEIFDQTKSIPNPQDASAMFWLWGQFVDHDLDLTVGTTPDEPFPISVPKGDPYFDPSGTGTVKLPLNRSNFDSNTGTNNPREQINTVSSFLDGSNIYGSNPTREKYCRKYVGGELLTSMGNMLPYNDGTMDNAGGSGTGLYVAGDVRANEQLSLTAMHTLWVREHNHWAKLLADYNCDWDDERIFQTTKTIVEAELQVITFNEFLPSLLGSKLSSYKGYDNTVNSQHTNEFTTAGYRFGHSMVSKDFKRLDEEGNQIWAGNTSLRDAFFSPWRLTNEGGIDPILRGFAATKSEKLDAKVINDLRNFLFGNPGQGGLDLVSLNIQRGREHGLSDYNTTRQYYGLFKFTNFNQITSDITLVNKLKGLYNTVDNIDLWVGLLVETPKEGYMMGELCREIVKEQFTRVRDGDRFWFENRFPYKLSNRLKRTRLSHVIQRNTDIRWIQRHVMRYKERY